MAIRAILNSLEEVDPKYQDLYTQKGDKWELTGVEGVKTQGDVDRVQAGLVKERAEHAKTKERFSKLAEYDLDDVVAKMDKYEELELKANGNTGAANEETINKIVETRLNSATAPLKRDLQKAQQAVVEKDKTIESYQSKEKRRVISDSIRAAAVKQNLQPTAIDDAILLGEQSFDLTEHGDIITRDGIGVTPGVAPDVWLTDLQASRPHWWGQSSGGGAGGSRSNNAGETNPFSHDNWNMTAQGAMVKSNPAKAEQMAKAAGTTVGGLKPDKK